MSGATAGPERLMVVDDDPAQAELIARLAKHLGVNVLNVGTAAEAEAHVGDVGLLVVDLSLPDSPDGLETIKRLVEARTCPVVIFTAHTDPKFAFAAGEAGAASVVVKGGSPLQQLEMSLWLAMGRMRRLERLRNEETDLYRRMGAELEAIRRQYRDIVGGWGGGGHAAFRNLA